MESPNSMIIDGNEYTWDGGVYRDKNKAKTKARRYLRWGRRVHVEDKDGSYYIYTYRPIDWDDYYAKKGGQE